MSEILTQLMPDVVKLFPYILKSWGETVVMVAVSGLFAGLLGVPLGIILVVTRKGNIMEAELFNSVLSKIINTLRSIPFVILIAAIPWLVRAVVGTTIGLKGAIVPLIIGCTPFVARQTELALAQIDPGVIEAYQAMGFSSFDIIRKVMLKEGMGGIIQAVTLSLISLVSFSAVAGSVGGGGLGDFAIRYGYTQNKTDIMVVTILIILAMVFLLQAAGDFLSRKVRHE